MDRETPSLNQRAAAGVSSSSSSPEGPTVWDLDAALAASSQNRRRRSSRGSENGARRRQRQSAKQQRQDYHDQSSQCHAPLQRRPLLAFTPSPSVSPSATSSGSRHGPFRQGSIATTTVVDSGTVDDTATPTSSTAQQPQQQERRRRRRRSLRGFVHTSRRPSSSSSKTIEAALAEARRAQHFLEPSTTVRSNDATTEEGREYDSPSSSTSSSNHNTNELDSHHHAARTFDFPDLSDDEVDSPSDAVLANLSDSDFGDDDGSLGDAPPPLRKSLSAPTIPRSPVMSRDDLELPSFSPVESPRTSRRLSALVNTRSPSHSSASQVQRPVSFNMSQAKTATAVAVAATTAAAAAAAPTTTTTTDGQQEYNELASMLKLVPEKQRSKSMRVRRRSSANKARTKAPVRTTHSMPKAEDDFDSYIKMIANSMTMPAYLGLHAETNRLHASNFDTKSARMTARKQRRSAATTFQMQ